MLRIRQEQLDLLDAVAREAFLDRAADFVEENWEAEYQQEGRAAARRRAAVALECCAAHGIEEEREVLRFLNVSYALGEGFERSDEHAWARAILTDASLDPEEKLDLLEERTEAELETP